MTGLPVFLALGEIVHIMEHDYERLIKVLTAAASLIGAFSMGSVPMSAQSQVLHTDTPAVWSLVVYRQTLALALGR